MVFPARAGMLRLGRDRLFRAAARAEGRPPGLRPARLVPALWESAQRQGRIGRKACFRNDLSHRATVSSLNMRRIGSNDFRT